MRFRIGFLLLIVTVLAGCLPKSRMETPTASVGTGVEVSPSPTVTPYSTKTPSPIPVIVTNRSTAAVSPVATENSPDAWARLIAEFAGGNQFAWSPDSTQFAVTFDTGISLYAVDSLQERPLPERSGFGHCVAFSLDGKKIMTVGLAFQIWNAVTTQPELQIDYDDTNRWVYMPCTAIAVSPNGVDVFTASNDSFHNALGYEIYHWNIANGEFVEIVEEELGKGFGFVHTMQISPNGKKLLFSITDTGIGDAVGNNAEDVRVIDLSTGQATYDLSGLAIAFSPDKRKLALAGLLEQSSLREFPSGGDVMRIHAHAETIAFTPDGNFLATGMGSEIKFWEVSTGQLRQTLSLGDPFADISQIAFSPDGRWLLVAARNTERKNEVGDNPPTVLLWGLKP